MEEPIIPQPDIVEETTPVEQVPVPVVEEVVAPVSPATPVVPVPAQADAFDRNARRPRGKNPRQNRPKLPREKPEFDSKMISIRRVTRVVAGGRRFSLSVAVVAGDRNGRVGLGTGKAMDTQLAIEKAMKQAKRNMIQLKLTKNKSIPHDTEAKFKSAKVFMMPNKGKGLIAGSSARIICNLAGLRDVTAKFSTGTKNKLNNARATMKALQAVAYGYGEAPVAVTKIPEAVKVEEK